MRTAIYFLVLSVCVVCAEASILIQEVYPDPIGSESDGEGVLIVNSGSVGINLSGYVIKTQTAATDAVLPGVILAPGQLFLVADGGWSTGRDNLSWPLADHEEEITLGNAAGGVSVMHGSVIEDAVGWGSVSDSGLYEGQPSSVPASGKSLQRVKDSGNNSADFVIDVPSWKVGLGAQQTTETEERIDVVLELSNSAPRINAVLQYEGDQVVLTPGAFTHVSLSVMVEDVNGAGDIVEVTALFGEESSVLNKSQVVNETTSLFEGTIRIPYYLPAGNQSVLITAKDKETASFERLYFPLATLVAFELEEKTLVLSGAGLSAKTRIENLGNTGVSFSAYGGPLTGSGGAVSELYYWLGDGNESKIPYQYNGLFDGSILDVGAGINLEFGIRAGMSGTLPSGKYNGTVALVGGFRP